jgi:hypothetical protein
MPQYSQSAVDAYSRKRMQIARGGMAAALGPMRAPSPFAGPAGISPAGSGFAAPMGGRVGGMAGGTGNAPSELMYDPRTSAWGPPGVLAPSFPVGVRSEKGPGGLPLIEPFASAANGWNNLQMRLEGRGAPTPPPYNPAAINRPSVAGAAPNRYAPAPNHGYLPDEAPPDRYAPEPRGYNPIAPGLPLNPFDTSNDIGFGQNLNDTMGQLRQHRAGQLDYQRGGRRFAPGAGLTGLIGAGMANSPTLAPERRAALMEADNVIARIRGLFKGPTATPRVGEMNPDVRTVRYGGGQPIAPDAAQMEAAQKARAAAALQEMQAAGVGQIDPKTGMFLGREATNLLGDARGQRIAGMTGLGPNARVPTQAELEANAAITRNQRAEESGSRQAAVEARAASKSEARRLRMGNLTMEERLQAGLPGYAVEQQRTNAARDIAGLNVGLGEKQIDAQERMSVARNELDKAIASGNNAAMLQAQEKLGAAQLEVEKTRAAGLLAATTERNKPEEARLEADRGYRSDLLGLKKTELTQQRDDQLLERARSYDSRIEQAELSNDFQKANKLRAEQQQILGQMSESGARLPMPPAPGGDMQAGMPQSWNQLPKETRDALRAAGPAKAYDQLLGMGISPDVAAAMLQDPGAFQGTHVTPYNKDGYGLSDMLGAATGQENWNRWASYLDDSPNAPLPFVVPGITGILQTYAGY